MRKESVEAALVRPDNDDGATLRTDEVVQQFFPRT
jgi:hypothetical protein